jgi:hypothetical protein
VRLQLVLSKEHTAHVAQLAGTWPADAASRLAGTQAWCFEVAGPDAAQAQGAAEKRGYWTSGHAAAGAAMRNYGLDA